MSRRSNRSRIRSTVIVLSTAALVAAGAATVSTSIAEAATGDSLGVAASKAGMFFGVAASPGRLSSFVGQEFTQLTPENEMKPETIAGSGGSIQNTGNADTLVNYAQNNNMIVRGHTMVWYSQAGSLQGANQSTLNNFIKNALLKWGNKITYWDVVNESLDDNNSGKRRNQWPHTLDKDSNNDGDFLDDADTDYIRDSFKQARQVVQSNNLKTKLCINDYDIEGLTVKGGGKNNKADAMYDIVKKYSQAPYKYIDCVGFQSHFNDNPNSIITNDLEANIRRFGELGVEVHLSELDIDDDLSNNDIGTGQADNYRKVVRACLNVPKCTGITVWGISDSESWRSSERGLLFTGGNGSYQKKAAYTAVLNELKKGRPTDPTPTDPTPTDPTPTDPTPTDPTPTDPTPTDPTPTDPTPTDPTPTDPTDEAACRISYTDNTWNSGFTAAVTISNTGDTPVSGWTLAWTWPGNQKITSSWNATVTQSGSAVTARNAGHNAAITAGGTASFGFQGSYSGTNTTPENFTLNGSACTVS
ncbi:MAG: endo,4-beta-xylanase [Actinomycetota bacterium]|nr:endo,4-beta-xylanase [Actinomycetota bacterium]